MRLRVVLSGFAFTWAACSLQAQFAPGNVIVYRTGDGATANLANTGSPITLAEYVTGLNGGTVGAAGASVAVPTPGRRRR